jgi:hypothetical protein
MATYSDPALILPGAVGQTELDAASKKDVASGVAALDAVGALLVPGSKIYYARDGSNDVHIYERTSDEEAYAFHRVGANDYTMFVKESNVWKQILSESMNVARIASDSYPGNNTANRAIAHGLGMTPKLVLLSLGTHGRTLKILESGKIEFVSDAGSNLLAVTAWDSTNFYVGNATEYAHSANDNSFTWSWVAFS